jgi:DNA-binding transcriptional regulator YiaG
MTVWNADITLIDEWLVALDQSSYEQAVAALELLAERGPQLGRPLVDTVIGSRQKNMKELRPGSSGRSELRVLFAFDTERQAIPLVAGDKAGNWKKWYTANVAVPDDRLTEHLDRLDKEGSVMAKSLDDLLSKRPADRVAVDAHKKRMLDEVRAYRLRELREASELTQVELAALLQVSQNRVSRLEHGDIERVQVDTLRKYVEAVGGHLRVEVELGDERIQIA